MPYRRLPKTDLARLKALKTVLDNNDVYTTANKVISWKTLNEAQHVYHILSEACDEYRICFENQKRLASSAKLRRNAEMFISHFLQVLLMAVERGEIKPSALKLYGLETGQKALPSLKSQQALLETGAEIIAGEKARIKKGGMPIYNPSIAKVAVHYDIFKDDYERHCDLYNKTAASTAKVAALRAEVDRVILNLWDEVETAFKELPLKERYQACRKYGMIFYYRRKEPHID